MKNSQPSGIAEDPRVPGVILTLAASIVHGLSKDLQDGSGSSEDTILIGKSLERNGDSLLSITGRLLDISKAKSALGEVKYKNGDIASYMRTCIEQYREHMESRGAEPGRNASEDGIEIDQRTEDYIEKIFGYLLSNSFKFSPEGGSAVKAGGGDSQFILKIRKVINDLIDKDKSVDVESVASQVCMSYNQLHRKISSLTGCTPAQWILSEKVSRAKRMLVSSPEKSLTYVAEVCGFGDYSSFVRAFRRTTGNTPSHYQKHPDIDSAVEEVQKAV